MSSPSQAALPQMVEMREHRLRERFCGCSRGLSLASVSRSNRVAYSMKFADGAFRGGVLAFANRAFVVSGDCADATRDIATNITPILPKSPRASMRLTNFMEFLAEKWRAADWVRPINFVRHKFRRYRRTSRGAVGHSLRSIRGALKTSFSVTKRQPMRRDQRLNREPALCWAVFEFTVLMSLLC